MMSIEECVEVLNKELKNVSHYNAMSPCMHRTHQEDMADAYTLTIQILSRLNVEFIGKIIFKDLGFGISTQRRKWLSQDLIQALIKEEE